MSTDGWMALDERFALSDAATIDEFHRRIVLFPPAARNQADAFEPVCLFRRHHQNDRRGAASSAFLLVTDSRWRNATGRIMNTIAETACIDDEDLDLLAQTFLAADRCVYWQAPAEWLEDGLEIVVEDSTDSGGLCPEAPSTTTDRRPIVIAREIRPPLRRWAAARLVRRDPSVWGSVLHRCGGLDARGAAAVMLGLLDATDSIPGPAQTFLRRRAADWPHRGVRAAVRVAPAVAKPSRPLRQPHHTTGHHVVPSGAARHSSPSAQERLF